MVEVVSVAVEQNAGWTSAVRPAMHRMVKSNVLLIVFKFGIFMFILSRFLRRITSIYNFLTENSYIQL